MEKKTFTHSELVILYNAVSGWALKLSDGKGTSYTLKNLLNKIEAMLEEVNNHG